MSDNKVLGRVKRLLQLSRSDNEFEAAQAAAKAAAMIEEHQLSEAMLRLDDEDARPAEKIVEEYPLEGEAQHQPWQQMHKKVTWKSNIAWGVSRAVGCRYWYSRTNQMRAFGRESAVQAWSYMCLYLFNEVDRLVEEGWQKQLAKRVSKSSARAWKNAFRVGASMTICERLEDAARAAAERRKIAKQHVEASPVIEAEPDDELDLDEPDDEAPDEVVVEDEEKPVANTEDLALVLVDKDHQEVVDAYEDFGKRKKWKKARQTYVRVSSTSGYEAGKTAGASVNIGKSRGALVRGQGRIGKEG